MNLHYGNLKGGHMCTEMDNHARTGVVDLCDRGLDQYRAALIHGITSSEVTECLLSLGLVRPAASSPGDFEPVSPDVALSVLSQPIQRVMLEQQDALTALRFAISRANSTYADILQQQRAPIRPLLGEEAISASLEEAVRSCREELLTAQPGGGRSEEVLAEALERDLNLCARGVRQRTLYQHTVRAHGPTLTYIERVTGAGAEVRTLDELFERLIICDRTVAFIPTAQQERRTAALLIEHPGVVAFLIGVFENAWERADAMSVGRTCERPPLLTDQTRQAILRLMVDGYTDASIASRLGLSPRSVAAHIKKAAEALGSRSRAQLAYLVAQSGLLDAPVGQTADTAAHVG